jgi:hypothetical protein
MIMSRKRIGGQPREVAADALAMLFRRWIASAGRQAIGLVATVIVRRAESRLLREMESLDARLLDDCGIGRGGTSPRRGGASNHVPKQLVF